MDAAEQTPPPAVETLFDDVYPTLSPHLVEQRQAVLDHIRTSGAIQYTGGKFPL